MGTVGRIRWALALLVLGGCGTEQSGRETSSEDLPCGVDDGPGRDPLGLTSAKTAAGNYRAWPKGRIPYEISSTVGATTKQRVLTAMQEWETKTQQAVRFVPAATDESPRLIVLTGAPMTSPVGHPSSGNSKVWLQNPEPLTVVRHELGHVLGLQHEHRRADRDKYIQVDMTKVKTVDNCPAQFNVCADCVLLGAYNKTSVMHYRTGELEHCRTGQVLLDLDGSPIQFEWKISPGDVAAVYELYGAPTGAGGTGGGGAGGTGSGGTTSGGAGGAAGASGAAGAGSSAGSAGASSGGSSGAGGSAGVGDYIDGPDEPPPSVATESGDDGGCAVGRGANGGDPAWWLAALALVPLTRRRARACS